MSKTLALAAVLFSALPVYSDVVLGPGADWEYTFEDPGDPSWRTTLGGWDTGPAPFGNVGDPEFGPGTYWGGGLAWVRRELDLTGFDLSTIYFDLGVDNGFALYVNGLLVDSESAEGYTYRWEYSGAIPEAYLLPDSNILAVELEDHGGLTAFDMQIRAGEDEGVVPEPATWVGAFSLALLASARLRRRN